VQLSPYNRGWFCREKAIASGFAEQLYRRAGIGKHTDGQQMPDETRLIERVARVIPSFIGTKGRPKGVFLGIGDDAMVIGQNAGTDWVVTVDGFAQDIHFWADRHPADSVGYKSLARATSDLAAMGAKPRVFLLTLALPKSRTGKWLDAFLRGMGRAARSLRLTLAGGDTTQSDSISIGITVFGEMARGLAVTRSGARPGDVLFVSGALGRAQLGLEIVRRGLAQNRNLGKLLQPHLYPQVRLELGRFLAERRLASAMMDISDGLSTDLARLSSASGVGARLFEAKIPQVNIPGWIARRLGGKRANPLDMALHGGDDYELLFTVPKQLLSGLRKAPGFRNLAAIGEIHRGTGVSLVRDQGDTRSLASLGWDPFRKK
jgi:thiamine-monophosphate kinase